MRTTPIRRPEPLRAAVYVKVASLLTSGQLSPGQAVTEAALSRVLGVSRTPVREALLRLEAEGVLESTLARGFVVRPLKPAEAAELYPILATLEGFAVRTSPRERSDLPRLRALARELSRTKDAVRRWRLDTELHEAIVAASPNGALREMISELRTNLSRYEIAFMREVTDRRDIDLRHEAALDALADRDSDRAADAIAKSWEASMRTVMGWLDKGKDDPAVVVRVRRTA